MSIGKSIYKHTSLFLVMNQSVRTHRLPVITLLNNIFLKLIIRLKVIFTDVTYTKFQKENLANDFLTTFVN